MTTEPKSRIIVLSGELQDCDRKRIEDKIEAAAALAKRPPRRAIVNGFLSDEDKARIEAAYNIRIEDEPPEATRYDLCNPPRVHNEQKPPTSWQLAEGQIEMPKSRSHVRYIKTGECQRHNRPASRPL